MAKETYYFPHDFTPTADEKIMGMLEKYGAMGYGLYWFIVEKLHAAPTHTIELKPFVVSAIASHMKTTSNILIEFLTDCAGEFELFKQDNNILSCERVNRNIASREEKTNRLKAAGSKGGKASVKHRLSTPQANKGNKSKGKESKVFIAPTAIEVQNYFFENGYRADVGLRAWEYYQSANWKDSQGKQVKSWKQKMQGVWFKDENLIPAKIVPRKLTPNDYV